MIGTVVAVSEDALRCAVGPVGSGCQVLHGSVRHGGAMEVGVTPAALAEAERSPCAPARIVTFLVLVWLDEAM